MPYKVPRSASHLSFDCVFCLFPLLSLFTPSACLCLCLGWMRSVCVLFVLGQEGRATSEGCFCDLRGPFRTKNPRYENCSHFWEQKYIVFFGGRTFSIWGSKNVETYLQSMFPYTEKYTESEYEIQNKDLLYKIHNKCPNAFELLESVEQ